MTDISDEEILRIIKNRFARVFEFGPAEESEDNFTESRGRKRALWHQLAVDYAEKREGDGISRNEACREFKLQLEDNHGLHVALETIYDVVRSNKGRPHRYVALPSFELAVLENNEEECVYWFKKLTPKGRAKWGFE
jgi:hypothetical protein